jgi:type VI secretion system protein VasG
MIGDIARLQLGRIEKRITANHGIDFGYSDEVIKLIASRCTELESGGRMIDGILTNSLLPVISNEILTRMLDGKTLSEVRVGVENGEFSYAFK